MVLAEGSPAAPTDGPMVFHDQEAAERFETLRSDIVRRMQDRYVWQEVPCVMCGTTDDAEPALRKWGIQMMRCRRCDHLYVSPRLPEEAVVDLYGSTYWDEYVRAIGSPTITERARFDYENAFYKMRRDVLPYRQAGRLLDVGASNGGMVKAASEQGFSAEGVEPAADVCRVAREVHGVVLHCGDVRELGLTPGSYDVITLHEVLEHLFAPVEVLAELRRLIAPAGILVIETPTTQSADFTDLGGAWPNVSPLEHVHLFSEANVVRLLDQLGFRLLDFYCPHENNVIAVAEVPA